MYRAVLIATSVACSLGLAPGLAEADDVTDALTSAIEAYEDGDIGYALEELEYAKQLLKAMKTDELVQYLPAAPEGWTREVNTEMNASLGMMGGGTGAEAEYSGSGMDSFTITLMADNPMVGAMAGLLGNAAAIGAKIERVGRQKFMVQNGELTGLVDSRILVKATGGDVQVMLDTLKTMDFKALADFGR